MRLSLRVAGLRLLTLVFLVLVGSCQTIPEPIQEYSLARAAMEAARVVQAPRHAPLPWQKAEEFYRQARILYREREYVEAKSLFIKAKQAAETAETQARITRFKNGEIL